MTGDVITETNNPPVSGVSALTSAPAGLSPGQKVPLTLTRGQGGSRTVTVTLARLPGS